MYHRDRLNGWQKHIQNVSKQLGGSDKKNLFKIASATWQSGSGKHYKLKLTPKQHQQIAFTSDYDAIEAYDNLMRQSNQQNTYPNVSPSNISEPSLNDLIQRGWIQTAGGCGCKNYQRGGGCGYKHQQGGDCGCNWRQRGSGLNIKLLLTPKQQEQIALAATSDEDYDAVELYDALVRKAKQNHTFPLVTITPKEHTKIDLVINKGWAQHGGGCGEELCSP